MCHMVWPCVVSCRKSDESMAVPVSKSVTLTAFFLSSIAASSIQVRNNPEPLILIGAG